MSRLANGVRLRKDGLYELRFTVDGKRYSVYGCSSKECKEKEHDTRERIKNGLIITSQNMKVDDLYKRYHDMKEQSIRKSSLNVLNARYNTEIKPLFGHRKVADVKKSEIEQWLKNMNTRDKKPKKATTCNMYLIDIRALFRFACEQGVIGKNPAEFIRPLKNQNPPARTTIHRALTDDEVGLFLDEVKGMWLYESYLFMLNTGCRCGEMSALTWNDIDEKAGVIHINKTMTYEGNGKGSVIGDTTKTKAGVRDIPINGSLDAIIKAQRKKMRDIHGNVIRMDGIVFESEMGKTILTETVNQSIRKALKRIKRRTGKEIPHFTSHAFRDTFATRFYENGGDPKVLQDILGHDDFNMTMNIYCHAMEKKKKEQMDVFGKIVNL